MGLRHNPWLLTVVSSLSIVAVSLLRSYILTMADLVALSHRLWDDGEVDEAEGTKVAGAVRTGEDTAQGVALQAKIPFLKRCTLIGECYGLTKREVDVFRLLAAGHNSARIQEELMISAGTVNTHGHHVFQKMGVHCQQEVTGLFEKADLDAIARDLKTRGV